MPAGPSTIEKQSSLKFLESEDSEGSKNQVLQDFREGKNSKKIKEAILVAVTQEAVPLYRIAEKAQVSVQTASKYCYILSAEGKVRMQRFGNMNLVRRSGR